MQRQPNEPRGEVFRQRTAVRCAAKAQAGWCGVQWHIMKCALDILVRHPAKKLTSDLCAWKDEVEEVTIERVAPPSLWRKDDALILEPLQAGMVRLPYLSPACIDTIGLEELTVEKCCSDFRG